MTISASARSTQAPVSAAATWSASVGPAAANTVSVKHFNHPVVGELSLNFERLDLAADDGLTVFTYTAEPGSRHEEALRLLGSWAATEALAQ